MKNFTQISFMKNNDLKEFEFLKNSDEKEILVKNFTKKEFRNEKL